MVLVRKLERGRKYLRENKEREGNREGNGGLSRAGGAEVSNIVGLGVDNGISSVRDTSNLDMEGKLSNIRGKTKKQQIKLYLFFGDKYEETE